jgi:hypothetical protein
MTNFDQSKYSSTVPGVVRVQKWAGVTMHLLTMYSYAHIY